MKSRLAAVLALLVATPTFAARIALISELTFKSGAGGVLETRIGPWTVHWSEEEGSVWATSKVAGTGKPCVILKKGQASPSSQAWRIAAGHRVLVYGETVDSELVVANLDTCEVRRSSPGAGTKITPTGYESPEHCEDGACRSVKVFRFDPKSGEFKRAE